VLIASTSIPGLFPPVMIPVETSGTILEEMHVDGNTTASMFIAPEIALERSFRASLTLPGSIPKCPAPL
jgi:hypothetical protein